MAATSEGYFVADLVVSRLRLQREQHVPGWCVLLLRRHVREPHELPAEERIAFFEDMGAQFEDRTTIGFAGLIEREFGGFEAPPLVAQQATARL